MTVAPQSLCSLLHGESGTVKQCVVVPAGGLTWQAGQARSAALAASEPAAAAP